MRLNQMSLCVMGFKQNVKKQKQPKDLQPSLHQIRLLYLTSMVFLTSSELDFCEICSART